MNILFITADQWRGECLSALGHPVLKTPHLDALAAGAKGHDLIGLPVVAMLHAGRALLQVQQDERFYHSRVFPLAPKSQILFQFEFLVLKKLL
mgnify:CR=1 FL=1